MKILIAKGSHLGTPLITKPWKRKVAGAVLFNERSVYDLKNNNQYDWNKITGISFNPLKPDMNSLMVAWRYNTTSKLFEVSAFFNRNSERLTAEKMKTRILKVQANKWVDFEVDYNGVKLMTSDSTIISGMDTIYVPNPSVKTSYLSSFTNSPWFGGDEVAPNDIEFMLVVK